MEVISICLSDIPKEKIVKAANGKKYINIVVDTKREADKYGNTLNVYISQSKEEREAKENKVYVGNGKVYNFNLNKPQDVVPEQKVDIEDDLPF